MRSKPATDSPVDPSIPFVDAHHHLWELGRIDYPWLIEPGLDGQTEFLGDYRAIRRDWGPARLRREFHGQNVTATVHVEAASAPEHALDETRWLDAVARDFGYPNGLVVFCDLASSGAAGLLEQQRASSALVRGVRARPELPEDPAFRRGFRAACRLGLSYDFSQSPGGLALGLGLARLDPDARIILAHTGFPLRRDPDYRAQWRREMTALSAASNVSVKISGLGMADHAWTVESIRPWVLDTIEAFGVERCMFGTNWPVDSLYSPYVELVDAYRRIIAEAGFSRDDQAALLHRNAERLYRL